MTCAHPKFNKFGCTRNGNARFRCCACKKTWTVGDRNLPAEKRARVLAAVSSGMSLRKAAKASGAHTVTVTKVRRAVMVERFTDALNATPSADRLLSEADAMRLFA